MAKKSVLLIITASIAAFKAVDLIRILKENNTDVTCVLTEGAEKLVSKMTLAVMSENKVYDNIFSIENETEMNHIKLSRVCDLVLVAPTTADFMAKLANGHADDLASTLVYASNKQVFLAPAMNPVMWEKNVTKRNLELIKNDGIKIIEPEKGMMACNENGYGRLAEPENIFKQIKEYLK